MGPCGGPPHDLLVVGVEFGANLNWVRRVKFGQTADSLRQAGDLLGRIAPYSGKIVGWRNESVHRRA